MYWFNTYLYLFSSTVRDIHDVIYLSVFNDGKNKDEKLGQLMLPLLRVNELQ